MTFLSWCTRSRCSSQVRTALYTAASGLIFASPAKARAGGVTDPKSALADARVESPSLPPRTEATRGLWGRPVRRGGFHFQAGFGAGGGADSAGIFHTMEIGYTIEKTTVGILHTFIQNRGQFGGTYGGPDLFGGWMLEVKHPLVFPDLVGKVALGLGGIHDQTGPGIQAHAGFGASYGVDLHFPIWERFGPTLTVAALHATALGEHYFGVGTALGVTLF